jgi:hypothetical protein
MSSDGLGLSGASPESAKAFVSSVDLGAAPPLESASIEPPSVRMPFGRLLGLAVGSPAGLEAAQAALPIAVPASASDVAGLRLKAAQDQAFFVGGQILSFGQGVTEERRAAALNSCLLAQLRASRLHPNPTSPQAARDWHAAYVNTLTNIGWVLQSGLEVNQTTGSQNASVEKVLLEVVGALLGGGAATALVTKVLQVIGNARKDDPLITLYESRVVEQRLVEFAAGIAAAADGTGFKLSIVECALEVQSTQSQVLFFKWSAQSARAEGRRFDLALSDTVYAAAKPQIEAKLMPFVSAYVAALEI